MTWRLLLAGLLFALQLLGIVAARFSAGRYFSWGPYDMQTDYRLAARVGGRALTPAEVSHRYRIPAEGTDNRSYAHVLEVVRLTETTYHAQDPAQVEVIFRINGGPDQRWRWP